MRRQKIKRRKKSGLPPGSVIFTGQQKVEKSFIHYLQYNEEFIDEHTYNSHDEIKLQDGDHTIDWYDLRGLHDTELIESLGRYFKIHPLVLEDIANVQQRPKFEEYEQGIFIIVSALAYTKETKSIEKEQVAIYFIDGLLLSFQETDSDLFISVRERVRKSGGKIRTRGADYLCYAIIDTIVDHYFVILEDIEDEIDQIEFRLLKQPDQNIREDIHHLKRELMIVKKAVNPMREVAGRFVNSDSTIIDPKSGIYIRDLNDHTIQLIDIVETYRDVLNGLQDLHLSEISNRMNEVMKVLTIITTIFVPLSFLAGLYGMNFVNIPELQNPNAYFILLIVMSIIALSLITYFKIKKWF